MKAWSYLILLFAGPEGGGSDKEKWLAEQQKMKSELLGLASGFFTAPDTEPAQTGGTGETPAAPASGPAAAGPPRPEASGTGASATATSAPPRAVAYEAPPESTVASAGNSDAGPPATAATQPPSPAAPAPTTPSPAAPTPAALAPAQPPGSLVPEPAVGEGPAAQRHDEGEHEDEGGFTMGGGGGAEGEPLIPRRAFDPSLAGKISQVMKGRIQPRVPEDQAPPEEAPPPTPQEVAMGEMAQEAIRGAADLIEYAPGKIDLSGTRVILDEARKAYSRGEMKEAVSLARKAHETTDTLRKKYVAALAELKNVQQLLLGLRKQNRDIAAQVELFKTAKALFAGNNYAGTLEVCRQLNDSVQ